MNEESVLVVDFVCFIESFMFNRSGLRRSSEILDPTGLGTYNFDRDRTLGICAPERLVHLA